jgi:predicted anti-sigma-YlaC factor YlaD
MLSPSVQVADSRLSVPLATQVLRHRTLDLSTDPQVTSLTNPDDVQRVDGRLLPFFPWPAMLFALPGVVVADAVGRDPGALRPSDPNQTWQIEVPVASLLVALTAVVLALIAFDVVPGQLRSRRRLAAVVAFVYAFSTGGSSYGPRLMTDALPFVVYLAIPVFAALFAGGLRASLTGGRRAAAIAMLVIVGWGALVNASGALLRSSYCWSAQPVLIDQRPSRIWEWTDPQFFRPVKDAWNGASLHDVVLESCSAT